MKWLVGLGVIVAGALTTFTSAGALSVDYFTIPQYDIQYELSRDSEGRSVLKTTEKITATFSQQDKNHGIERAIPSTYDGHPVSLSIGSVTNENGQSVEYSTREDNGNTIVRIGNPSQYAHGDKTYVLTYTQRDVTRFYQDTGKDEWYWDTNGTGWRVPISQLTVSIRLDGELASLTGTPSCYVGAQGATNTCDLQQQADGSYRTSASNLASGENITVAFGFPKDTFTAYTRSFGEWAAMIWGIALIVSIPIMLILIFVINAIYIRRTYRVSELKPIPVEFIPPRYASVQASAQVVGQVGVYHVFTAQLIDLAVRRFVSIIETRPKTTWKAAEYDIAINQSLSELKSEEMEILTDMFGRVPQVGDRLPLKTLRNNTSYQLRTLDNDKKLKKLLEDTYRLRAKSPVLTKLFNRWAVGLLIASIVLLMPTFLLPAIVAWVSGLVARPLTDEGLALRRYVMGLDRYIKASEVERLKFFQGPETAEKVGYSVDTNNPGQLVKLYERVLPYAILFGREKQWSKQLGAFYENSNTQPEWYNGSTAFNAVVFTSAMSSFSTATSYTSGTSSSSGGSGGGGFSGGGGGGGGGGGW
ncbi:hypothetical protein BGO18_01280 [Candidatus Saccharibacteria bacterium 47-87]|nr:DUF2207 domain-containing protein [Candidatus Saccharibacteria bacterium]OJU96800.1 MAG: hypothetical protein BGO18_01280 [Candidatus Saccharibacteria bacterium 47-87]